MRNVRRFIALLGSVATLSTAVVILSTHAADQTTSPVAAQPVSAAKAAVAKPPAPGAPQVSEESATIRDDPTLVPDPKQSADNSVSFPNDI